MSDTKIINYGTNIYTAPKGLMRRTIYHSNTHLMKELDYHAQSICRHKLTEQYTADVLNPYTKNFSRGYAYYLDDEIVGFVVWNIKEPKIRKPSIANASITASLPSKYLFIELICAIKTYTDLGYKMLDDVEDYCVKNAIPFMKLSPADDDLIPYYEKYGFTLTSKETETIMTKAIITLLNNYTVNYKSLKTRKIRQLTKPRPQLSEKDRVAILLYQRDAEKLSQNIKNIDLFIKNLQR